MKGGEGTYVRDCDGEKEESQADHIQGEQRGEAGTGNYAFSEAGVGAERKSFSRDGEDSQGTLGDESEGDGRYHGSCRSDISRDSVGASCALTQGSLGSSCICDGCNSGMRCAQQRIGVPSMRDAMITAAAGAAAA